MSSGSCSGGRESELQVLEEATEINAPVPASDLEVEPKASNNLTSKSHKKRRRKVIVFPRKRSAMKRPASSRNKPSKDCGNRIAGEGKSEAKPDIPLHFVKVEGQSNIDAEDENHSQDLKTDECAQSDGGWSREQEEALHNAYFLVKPGPNFWREIAKRVPGKASKECFDRFYSAYPTPPPLSTHARRYDVDSPIKPMAGDLFATSPMPVKKTLKRFGKGKLAILEAHRTVRQLLRKQQTADEAFEADIFAAVEVAETLPLPVSICAANFTPQRDAGILATCGQKSNNFCKPPSALKLKQQSVESSAYRAELQSPEVLKKENNPGRLDRYLDKLFLRHVWRSRHVPGKRNILASAHVTKRHPAPCVQAAKAAVAATAREMIQTVVNRQLSALDTESMTLDESEDDLISLG